jgi:hypothetical protein
MTEYRITEGQIKTIQELYGDRVAEILSANPLPDTCPETCIYKRFAKNMENAGRHDQKVLDAILKNLYERGCVGRALEKIDEERGKGWLRTQLLESLRKQDQP